MKLWGGHKTIASDSDMKARIIQQTNMKTFFSFFYGFQLVSLFSIQITSALVFREQSYV